MDTYFFDYNEALEEAKRQNKFSVFDHLQICYYNGEDRESEYENLIGVPIDDFCDYVTESPNRAIENIRFDRRFNAIQKVQIKETMHELQNVAFNKKYSLGLEYKRLIREQKPDFSEPWRILFVTTRGTTVLQYVCKNMAEAFSDLGYETFVSIESSAMEFWGGNDTINNPYFVHHLKNIYEYNPHIIINIDWINNNFLHDDVFNFVWFQDPMPILKDNEKIIQRERDFYFYLVKNFKEQLVRKHVEESKIFYQPFCTNPNLFKLDSSIKRENKIVFLGGNYPFDKDVQFPPLLLEEIIDLIQTNQLTFEKVNHYSIRLNIEHDHFLHMIIPAIVRRETIKWMCQLQGIEIEVYGEDSWLDIEEVKPYYKGLLPYGEEMAKVYNSAKYAVVSHSEFKYQQRLMEISACGAIPLVYEGRVQEEDFFHDDNILTFSTLSELQDLIGKEPKKDPLQISQDISYEKMAQKIIEVVEKNVR